MDVDYAAIGERVRERRRQLGMTQYEICRLADISLSFVGHIERAEKISSLETMARLSAALDLTLDYLVFGIKTRCAGDACPMFSEMDGLLRAYGLKG